MVFELRKQDQICGKGKILGTDNCICGRYLEVKEQVRLPIPVGDDQVVVGCTDSMSIVKCGLACSSALLADYS